LLLDYALFFGWIIFLSWSFSRIQFIKNAGLGNKIIIGIFLCKIVAGLIGGSLSQLNLDTWNYHKDALIEYHLLFSDPKEYFTNLFHTGYANGYDGLLVTQNSYWNDLKTNFIIKIISVLDIFSGGNYYVNVVLYNYVVLFGNLALYRVFKQVFTSNNWLLLFCVFMLPSFLYYGSSIHKDGLMLCAIGVVLFNVFQSLHAAGLDLKRLFGILIGLLVIFILRNFVFIAILPALTAVIIAYKKKYPAFLTFGIVYLIAALIFFNIRYFLPSVDLPAYIVQKQADFMGLESGNTTIVINKLSPSFTSFIANAPGAFFNGLCRPHFGDIALSRFLLPLCVELLFYQLLIVIFLLSRKTEFVVNDPLVMFCIFFGLSVCLIVGYTVPVIGAIVRYRSIYLPFLMTPFILNIDWKKIRSFIRFSK
jgi:hypothetical protein